MQTRVKDRAVAGMEAGDGEAGDDDNGNDRGVKAETGIGPEAEADGAARAETKTRGKKEAERWRRGP